MSTALDFALADQCKPTLDKIEPRCQGRREMYMEARMASEPVFDRGSLVSAVVVQDQVRIEFGRDIGFDGAQERKELFGAVTPMHFVNDMSGGEVQCRKQGRRAVPTHSRAYAAPVSLGRAAGSVGCDPRPESGSFHPRTHGKAYATERPKWGMKGLGLGWQTGHRAFPYEITRHARCTACVSDI